VTSTAHDPRTYTATAGRQLTGTWTVEADFDLTVHGPNGFLRRFRGAGPDVTARHDASGEVHLTLANHGTRPVTLIVGGSGPIRLRAGQRATHTIRAPGWYDVSITSDADHRYLRRLAGHVETGGPGTSDPALA
jgi:phospholipase C